MSCVFLFLVYVLFAVLLKHFLVSGFIIEHHESGGSLWNWSRWKLSNYHKTKQIVEKWNCLGILCSCMFMKNEIE